MLGSVQRSKHGSLTAGESLNKPHFSGLYKNYSCEQEIREGVSDRINRRREKLAYGQRQMRARIWRMQACTCTYASHHATKHAHLYTYRSPGTHEPVQGTIYTYKRKHSRMYADLDNMRAYKISHHHPSLQNQCYACQWEHVISFDQEFPVGDNSKEPRDKQEALLEITFMTCKQGLVHRQ